MTLTYTILWVDEDSKWFNARKNSIIREIEKLYFDVNIIYKRDGSEVIDVLKNNNVDLVIMDYKLVNESGADVIQKIRKNEMFNIVLFYSQEKNFMDEIFGLEFVFFAHRRSLKNKITKVVPITIEKNNDINSMRGIIIAETIELEYMICDIIVEFFNQKESTKNTIDKYIHPEYEKLDLGKRYDLLNVVLKEKIKELEKKYKETSGNEKEKYKKLKAELSTCKSKFTKINKEIIDVRNVMGHVKESKTRRNVLIGRRRKKDPIIIDTKFCTEQRKIFKEHNKNLGLMREIITS